MSASYGTFFIASIQLISDEISSVPVKGFACQLGAQSNITRNQPNNSCSNRKGIPGPAEPSNTSPDGAVGGGKIEGARAVFQTVEGDSKTLEIPEPRNQPYKRHSPFQLKRNPRRHASIPSERVCSQRFRENGENTSRNQIFLSPLQ